ncbi:CAP domain-containing protein [Nonomuraea basaltis]|uniref:CAP domain-containing protein n=1 Tax=Nonomuraea basaltis TaxID=2495887 RepID=UPI00110C4853|nr:CAP domain-containing protein [Nonomuraea basaltis]TMR91912.1 CAP domain-containing protein [Nonomuraea basaltis]
MRRPLGLLAAAAALATIAAPVSTAQAVTASPASGVGRSGSLSLFGSATTASVSGAARVGTARENMVVRLVNARRAKKGCRALKHHPQLHRAARGHSADMAEYNYFSSTSRDGRSFTDRIKEAGFTGGTSLAENIAKGQRTPAAVVQSWMGNSGTKATIMNCKFTFIGVGAVDDSDGAIYWTQVFAAK